MIESQNCINTLKQVEGFSATPYLDSGNVPSIGYGTTYYPDDSRVTMVDKAITQTQADDYLRYSVDKCVDKLNQYLTAQLTQSQFDACVLIAYNIGNNAFDNSTLLQTINNNPNDLINIYIQFKRWIYVGGKVVRGLENRREIESQLYSSNEVYQLYVSDLDLNLPIYRDYLNYIGKTNF
jgi:lysozyme